MMNPRGIRWGSCVVMLLVSLSPLAIAGDGQPDTSLDEQLLEDLDRELGLDVARPTESGQETAGKRDADTPALNREMFEQLERGEDLGEPTAGNPLADIERRMRVVRGKIDDDDISVATQQLQQQIVSDLEALIQQCKKQCQSGKPGGQCDSPGQNQQPGKSAAKQSTLAARDSTDRLEKDDARQSDLESMQQHIKETWGHLPARLREPMLNSGVEQFLPKYQQLIEDYFRRLAEDSHVAP